MRRPFENYFDGATDTSDGITAGLSRTWFGNGDIELVSLDNPSNTAILMERREHGRDDAKWMPAGGMTRTSVHRLNLFSSGFEFRARMIESSTVDPVRLTIQTLDQIHRDDRYVRHDMVTEAFSRGHIIGFDDPVAKGIIEYGTLEELKDTTAFMFFCYDPDPAIQAIFGGAWEKYGVDYRKLHINGTQFLLSTAIDTYNESGGTDTGGGTNGATTNTGATGTGTSTEGLVGGIPLTRVGTATLITPPTSTVALDVYSSVLGEVLWGDPVDEIASLDKYEVSVNGIIEYIGSANSLVLYNLTAQTTYTASIVRFRDDGTFSNPLVVTNTTPATGVTGTPTSGTGTTTTTPTDGTATSFAFNVIDAYARSYAEVGTAGQTWLLENTLTGYTGGGYIRTSNVTANGLAGARSVYLNQAPDQTLDRRIWIRCRADVAGDQFGIASHGNGALGVVTVNSVDWVWLQSPAEWAFLDESLQIYGFDGGVSVDKIIVQSLSDTSIPTGVNGLVSA